MNAEFINPFVTSTMNVFATMLGCHLTRGTLQLRSNGFVPKYEINGIVGLSGRKSGTVIISMQEQVALHATEAMLGVRPPCVNDEVIDAVGEITNMVAGAAKCYLSAYDLSLSVPTVIIGKNTRIGFTSKIGLIGIPYESPWGPLQVEVGFAN